MKQLKKFKEMILDMQLQEVLSKDASAGDWIHDFVHSDNPKFAGKSKEKRKEMALAAYYAKQRNEEVELDEAVDPSEVAGNPRMYDAATVKKAYYHKKATPDEKKTLERHLDRHHGMSNWRKPVKEEAEQIDELSRDTLLSYANKVSLDSQKHSKDPTKRSGEKASRSVTGYARAHNRLEKPVKEEVELEESATVKTQKYSWGTMKTVHHGKDFSIPLHPEHHEPIAKLKDNQEHKFKDETGRHWTAKRMGDDVHFHSANDGPKTKVAHKHIAEGVIQPSGTDKIETAGSPVSDIGTQNLKVKKVKSFKFFTTEAAKTGNPGFGYHGAHKTEHDSDAAYDKMHSHVKSLTDGDDKTVKHYLDSAHGRHLVGLEHDHEHIKKDFKKFKKHYRPEMHEEVELDEAFINGREYASQGVMHPDHAKMHKVGDSRDFYAHGTGDKLSGKVTKNDGKEVHIQADKTSGGKTHKFKVTPHLPKQQNEAVKPVNVDKVNAAGQEPHEEKWEPAKKKMKKESVSFSDFLKQLDEIKMADLPGRKIQGKSYGANYEDPEGAFETKDDMKKAEPKKAGRKVGQKVGARANLGNSKLHRA
jgi:predicted CopG family antitoxin